MCINILSDEIMKQMSIPNKRQLIWEETSKFSSRRFETLMHSRIFVNFISQYLKITVKSRRIRFWNYNFADEGHWKSLFFGDHYLYGEKRSGQRLQSTLQQVSQGSGCEFFIRPVFQLHQYLLVVTKPNGQCKPKNTKKIN